MNVNDKVTVKFKTATGWAAQKGTISKLLPGGRFEWKNECNAIRTASPEHITDTEVEIKLHPYVAQWVSEEE